MAAESKALPKLGTIVHCEIIAKDTQKLVDFYGGVFGWKFAGAPNMEDYKMASMSADADIAIFADAERRVTNYISVDNIKTYAEKIKAHGGTIAHEFTVASMGHGAIGFDPEGNSIGIWQADPTAQE